MNAKLDLSKRTSRSLGCALLLGAAAALAGAEGCVSREPARDYGDPSALNTPTTQGGIVAYVVSPRVTEPSTSAIAEVVIAAYAEGSNAPLDVELSLAEGPRVAAEAAGEPGPAQRFRARIALLHGANVAEVRIATRDGSRVRRLEVPIEYIGAAPGVRYQVLAAKRADDACAETAAAPKNVVASKVVCVRGQVTTKAAAKPRVAVGRAGGAEVVADVRPDGRFEAAVELTVDQAQTLAARATDADGTETVAELAIVQDSTPPSIVLTNVPGGTARSSGPRFAVAGSATDANGVAAIRLELASGGVVPIAVAPSWEAAIDVTSGTNRFAIVAEDVAGNTERLPFAIVRDRLIQLGAPNTRDNGTLLRLDKDGIQELLTVDDQRAITLVEIPLRAAIVNALRTIRDAATNGTDTSAWRAAEWNMYRLLNMTPDTADLRGSSVDALLTIAAAVGLPPARVLAQLLDIGVTDTFIDADVIADVVLERVIGSHPNITRDGSNNIVLKLSMYDVFQELATVAPRFGRAGAHPGFLRGATRAKVFEPGFALAIPVVSTLVQYVGVDAKRGTKDFIFLRGGEDVLEFDFLSDRFSVVGLVDEPAVDLSFVLEENTRFLSAGTVRNAGADADRPGFFRGNGAVWATPVWQIEHVITEAAYRHRHTAFAPSYQKTLRYNAGSIVDAAVLGWDRGWVTMQTSGGVGAPPPPTYIWDILSEVAQIRLHDGGIREGEANIAFDLKKLPIGLSADQLIASLRPTLQAQEAELSRRLIGSSGLAAASVDFFFVAAEGGAAAPFLFFRAPGDAPGPYPYATPGFFADAAFTRKVSTTDALPGTADTKHEKVVAAPGAKFYIRDKEGAPFLVEVSSAGPSSVTLRVEPQAAP
jgi:hypothetical protein